MRIKYSGCPDTSCQKKLEKYNEGKMLDVLGIPEIFRASDEPLSG